MKTFVDICIFSIVNKKLSILLGKRADNVDLFPNQWSISGGHYGGEEPPEITADFQLHKNLGVQVDHLEQIGTFAGPTRDPRGPSLSIAYMALINHKKVKTIKTDKMSEVQWFPIDELPYLPFFDHKKIIQVAIERIRRQIRYTKIGFDLVGETFTMNELIEIFSEIIQDDIDRSNLRNKLLDLGIITQTKKQVLSKKGRGRPSPIFKINRNVLNSLPNTIAFFKKEN